MQDRQLPANSGNPRRPASSRQNVRRRKRPTNAQNVIRLVVGVLLVVCLLFAFQLCKQIVGKITGDDNNNSTIQTDPSQTGPGTSKPQKTKPGETTPVPTTTEPPAPQVVSTASVGVTGDVLMHGPVINAGKKGSSYEFSQMFQYVKPYYEKYDIMVANLECTLGGPEAGDYKGYPTFNCPDQIIDALKGAGVDLMLTANNHSYDTGFAGFKRTLETIQGKGLPTLGTQLEEDAKEYIVQDVNGIKVGLICYTYETGGDNPDRNYLNGIQLNAQASNMVTCFNYSKLDAFYSHLQTQLTAMEAEGAEATVVFIHWGDEYALDPNANQKKIAQRLCDMGIDVIVGGHPHVVEPFETLTSPSGEKTYCIYSVGNALSNQNRNTLTSANKEYTEDGMIFGVTFQKWSDGKVEVAGVEITPTWVDKFSANTSNGVDYRIYPLDASVESWSGFGASKHSRLTESYNRTMKLVGEGLNAARVDLGLDSVVTSVSDK